MAVVKLRKIGNSLGFILPKEEVSRLNVGDGDTLSVARTENGIEISSFDPGFKEKIQAFDKSRRRYRNALRELAK